jgi:hypothetical protein
MGTGASVLGGTEVYLKPYLGRTIAGVWIDPADADSLRC